MLDQYTWDVVAGMAMGASLFDGKSGVIGVRDVLSVSIEGGSVQLEPGSTEVLPTKFEEHAVTVINCTGSTQKWTKDLKIETTIVDQVEISQSVSSTTEFKVSIGFGPDFARFNGDMMQNEQVSISAKASRTVTQTVTEEIHEDREVAAHTAFTMKTVVTKGVARGRLTGVALLDATLVALVRVEMGMVGHIVVEMTTRLTNPDHFRQEPRFRTTAIAGWVASETSDSVTRTYHEATLDPSQPPCAQSHQLHATGHITTLATNLFELPGTVHLRGPMR